MPGAITSGFIQFSIAGGIARDSSFSFTGGAFDAAQDENSVLFTGDTEYETALRIKEYVENYREKSPSSPVASFSIADEILKLKTLMDQGIISAEEFEMTKKRLLAL